MAMKETKEATLALMVIGKFVVDRLKDGAQLDDAMALGQALLVDGKFKETVLAGVKDANLIGEEISSAKLGDYLSLATELVPEVISLLKG